MEYFTEEEVERSKTYFIVWGLVLTIDTVISYIGSLGMNMSYGILVPWVSMIFGTLVSLTYLLSFVEKFSGTAHIATRKGNQVYWATMTIAILVDISLFVLLPRTNYCNPNSNGVCTYDNTCMFLVWACFVVWCPVWFFCI